MASEKNRRAAHAAGHMGASPRRRRPAAPEVSQEDRITTIRSGQGATVTTRKNAAQAARRARRNAERRYYERHPEARESGVGPERSGRNVVLLVVLSVLALAIVFFVGSCVTALLNPAPDTPSVEETQNEQRPPESATGQGEPDAENEQAAVDGSVSYKGESYALQQQDDGLMGVVRTAGDGMSEVLFKVEGTPAAIMRHGVTILVPENRDGGWDVVCYVIDGHSDPSYVVAEDGSKVSGSGDVVSAELDGTTLRVSDSTGATTEVTLG